MPCFRLAVALSLLGFRGLGPAQTSNVSQAANSGNYRIAGRVVSKVDARLLARARITISDPRDPQKAESVITAEDGKFEFTGLPAGKYVLAGAKHGFISASYDQHEQFSTAIVTGAGVDTENLTLRLAPNATIAGKVLDEFGEQVRQATVNLYHDVHGEGRQRVVQSRRAMTDDQGAYEITPLAPGTYYLSATAKPWYAVHPSARSQKPGPGQVPVQVDGNLDVAYPVTFYADVTDSASATPIQIRGGDNVQADIHLNPVPALHFLFHVGDTSHGYTMPLLEQAVFDGATWVQPEGGRVVSPGVVELTGVLPGRYDVQIPGASQVNGVVLSKDEEEIDLSRAGALSSVKFRVQVRDTAMLPARLTVGLRSGTQMPKLLQVDPKGGTDSAQIPSGAYEVFIQGSTTRYSLIEMKADGGQVSGHTLTIPPGSSLSASITIVAGNVEVEGTVKKAGHAFAGAMVVLVPKDPEMNRDLFRRDQSDLDGTFSLHGVVPGSYTLLAIENGWDLQWSQPTVISGYVKRGQKIQVGSQGGQTLDVTQVIEVQPE